MADARRPGPRITIGLALLAASCFVPLATGHAVPLESSPAANERVMESPDEVWIRFTEPIYEQGSWIQVRDIDNQRIEFPDLRLEPGDEPIMRVGIPPLEPGAYRMVWQIHAQTDGHIVGGSIGFAVGGFVPPETVGVDEDAVDMVGGLARALLYAGYVVAFGALAWWLLVIPPASREAARPRLWTALLAATALGLAGSLWVLILAGQATGLGRTLLVTEGGRSLTQRTLVLAGLLVLTPIWSRLRSDLPLFIAAVGWAAAVWIGARFGHADASGPWALVVQAVHVIAMSAWVGGIGTLAWQARSGDVDFENLRRLGRRFSGLAVIYVAGIAVSGVMLTTAILGGRTLHTDTWATTAWGRIIVAKILLAGVMVVAASLHRALWISPDAPTRMGRWLDRTGRAMQTDRPGRSTRNGLLAMEGVFGVVIIVLAGLLLTLGAP